jgi:hypothetical protein
MNIGTKILNLSKANQTAQYKYYSLVQVDAKTVQHTQISERDARYSRVKDKNRMVISTDAENHSIRLDVTSG